MRNSIVYNFLNETFVFRSLEIHNYFNPGGSKVFFNFRNRVDIEKIDNQEEPCWLLNDHEFDNWWELDKNSYKFFLSEFEIYLIKKGLTLKIKRREIKIIIENLIKYNLVKTIDFYAEFKTLIEGGRKKVKGVKRSPYTQRQPVKIIPGKTYYICTNSDKSNIANPCYVLKKEEGQSNSSFRVMYFTDVKDTFTCGNKTEINGWGFCTVNENELGTTPEQAVINKQG